MVYLDMHTMDIYLYHDPLEYAVLWMTFRCELPDCSIDCIIYGLSRTAVVAFVSLLIGMVVSVATNAVRNCCSRARHDSDEMTII